MVLGGFTVYEIAARSLLIGALLREVVVGYFRAQAVALFSDHKEQASVDVFPPQPLGSPNFCRDDALGIARPASVDARGILRGRDERRYCVHVRGEHNGRMWLL